MSDSVWATVLGIAQMFGKGPQFALHGISFANAMLYSKAMPKYGDGDGAADKPKFDESKDACDLSNFKSFTDDEEIVRI